MLELMMHYPVGDGLNDDIAVTSVVGYAAHISAISNTIMLYDGWYQLYWYGPTCSFWFAIYMILCVRSVCKYGSTIKYYINDNKISPTLSVVLYCLLQLRYKLHVFFRYALTTPFSPFNLIVLIQHFCSDHIQFNLQVAKLSCVAI